MFASMFAMILSFSLVGPSLIFSICSSSVICLDGLWGWFSIIVWILSLISVSARFPFSPSLKESLNLSALGVLADVMELANDSAVL